MEAERKVVLTAEGARFAYGDLVAVWDVTMQAIAGETLAIVGRNGAGKTTLLFGLAGILPTVSGTVTFADRDVTKLPPWIRSAVGLCLVPEGKRVFRELTVEENVRLGVPRGVGRNEKRERMAEIFDRFSILHEKRSHLAGSLSGGQQQLLAIASVMPMRPKVLLVDEPSSGLSPVATEQVMATLDELKREGLAIVLVEQLIEEVVTGIADNVLVIEQGRVLLEDIPERISLSDLEQRLYVA